jgi:hypothetical protein
LQLRETNVIQIRGESDQFTIRVEGEQRNEMMEETTSVLTACGRCLTEPTRSLCRLTISISDLKKQGKASTFREMGVSALSNDFPLGAGFGLGFAVVEDGRSDQYTMFKGELFWSGAASTFFFIDPKKELAVVFMTQLMIPDQKEVPLAAHLHNVVYGALSKL